MNLVFRRGTADKSVVYFPPRFIRNPGPPLAGWVIDLSTSRCPVDDGVYLATHWHGCFAGVIVKDLSTSEVWRLTGKVDHLGYFEARWPD
jgi:hypothetical protein